MIEYRPFITRAMLRNELDKLFVFGDNIARKGLGGQAWAMRGEPNAVGIPTKWSPSMRSVAFFDGSDSNFIAFTSASRKDIKRLREYPGVIVWPTSGIGTGRAKLQESSPRIWKFIEDLRRSLEDHKKPS